MIKVHMEENSITVTGHAGAGPPGQDLVCCAVSTLINTLIKALHDLTVDKADVTLTHGYASIEYGTLSKEATTMVDAFFIGICGLADSYPECIKVI